MTPGQFTGIGVGPGPAALLPLAALAALQQADWIYAPRAQSAAASVALQCLAGIEIAAQRIREIAFQMEPDRGFLASYYAELAHGIACELEAGQDVVYLTIGDTMTYSTYGYLLTALKARLPSLRHHTFPGITSYAAAAAALDFSLGEGKERTLILPCPDDAASLRQEIETHDIVVLMKIGKRLPWVLELLRELGITEHCAFARRIGLAGEMLQNGVQMLDAEQASGYLATMLIRRQPASPR